MHMGVAIGNLNVKNVNYSAIKLENNLKKDGFFGTIVWDCLEQYPPADIADCPKVHFLFGQWVLYTTNIIGIWVLNSGLKMEKFFRKTLDLSRFCGPFSISFNVDVHICT